MPQTVYDVGDKITSRLKLGVAPDGTTVVSVAVIDPNGTAVAVGAPAGPVNVDEYTVQWTAALAGDYRAVWSVAGTGFGSESKLYPVRDVPAGYARPGWAPRLEDVAAKVPTRTLDQTVRADGIFLPTFTGNTTPTDDAAQGFIDGATRRVLGVVGTVAVAHERLARDAAAWQAAADIELAYPNRDADVSVQVALQKRADAELTSLVTVVSGAAVASSLTFMYGFPEVTAWPADETIY